MKLLDNLKGGYRFLTGIAPYSSGVVAMPGFEIEHVVLHKPIPYRQGFELVERHLTEQGRPLHALCGIELRSSKPFSFEGFAGFNEGYRDLLSGRDLLVNDHNPVARTNVAPELQAPHEPSLYGFSYATASNGLRVPVSFVIAGAGDLIEGRLCPEAIVRRNEVSPDALREKGAYVMKMMQARLAGMGVTASDVTAVDIYTVHPVHSFLVSVILDSLGPFKLHGVHWFYSRPPIEGLEFEMDMRGVRREIRLR